MTGLLVDYGENPDALFTDALFDATREYREQFRSYWGLDAEEPPEDLEERTWKVLRLWDQLADEMFVSAQSLQKPEDGTLLDLVELFRDMGYDPTDQTFFRQRFELELTEEFSRNALSMVDRALELVDLLMETDSRRAESYLRRLADCFIRGLETETVIMCGAVQEAALEAYMDDGDVRDSLSLSAAEHVSTADRLRYLDKQEILPEAAVKKARRIKDDRNQAVHVAPGSVANPRENVRLLADVLKALEPPAWLDN